ncbi:CCHC-type domain-containing protein [Pycnococcus provasolii]
MMASNDLPSTFCAAPSVFIWPRRFLLSPEDSRILTRVHVLHSAHAKRTATVAHPDSGHGKVKQGRVLVSYEDGEECDVVKIARLVPAIDERDANNLPLVVICPDTRTFRHLAQAFAQKDDRILEIGSSWGVATNIIHQQGAWVLGVDSSAEGIEASRKKYPDCQFELLDCLQDMHRLKALADKHSCNKVCVDVGGDRSLDVLAMLLPFVEQEMKPDVCVVKCEEMHAHAVEHGRLSHPEYAEHFLEKLPHADEWRAKLAAEARSRIQLTTGSRTNFTLHPRRFPAKFSPDGLLICRYHNYATCKKLERCDYDHRHCNVCLLAGHKATQCPAETYFGRGGIH